MTSLKQLIWVLPPCKFFSIFSLGDICVRARRWHGKQERTCSWSLAHRIHYSSRSQPIPLTLAIWRVCERGRSPSESRKLEQKAKCRIKIRANEASSSSLFVSHDNLYMFRTPALVPVILVNSLAIQNYSGFRKLETPVEIGFIQFKIYVRMILNLE